MELLRSSAPLTDFGWRAGQTTHEMRLISTIRAFVEAAAERSLASGMVVP